MQISSTTSQDTLRILAAGAQVDMTAIKQKQLAAANPPHQLSESSNRSDTFERAEANPVTRSEGRDPVKIDEHAITRSPSAASLTPNDAQGTRVNAQDQPITPRPGPGSNEPAQDGRTFTESDRDALLAAWGARVGDERYNPEYDLTGDGMIGAADLAALLSRFSTEAPAGPAPIDDAAPGSDAELTLEQMISELRSMWGARTGSERYDPRYDLDGDGVIGSGDLAALLGGASPPTLSDPLSESPGDGNNPENPETVIADASFDLKSLLDAFGRRAGEPGFDARLDLNGDGVISSADLAALLGGQRQDAEEQDGTDPVKTPFSLAELGDLRSLLGKRLGMAGYNPRLDLDADGLLSVKDLAGAIGRIR
ncbi:MAG: hypothetical protein EA376_12430 [Phycisphaeraceae bacterium]|nr:MAG: hypothetical protein EA376_12430 [Phycisphaeraceae bacterium]